MIRFVLAASVALTLAGQALAATVDLKTYAMVANPADQDERTNNSTHDTATEGPLHYRTVAAQIDNIDVDSKSLSGVDLSQGALRARSRLTKAPNSGPTRGQATASSTVRESYTVAGNGKARVDFTIYGDFFLLSDIPDLVENMIAFGFLNVHHNGNLAVDSLSSADPTDPLFGLANGPFHRLLSFTFDVLDGEEFDVTALITADIRSYISLEGAFDMQVDVKAGLRVVGLDGTTLTPSDETPISPVPLPASGLLLLSPLAALLIARRKRQLA